MSQDIQNVPVVPEVPAYKPKVTAKKTAVTSFRIGTIALPVATLTPWVGSWLFSHYPTIFITQDNALIVAGFLLTGIGSISGGLIRGYQNWKKHHNK